MKERVTFGVTDYSRQLSEASQKAKMTIFGIIVGIYLFVELLQTGTTLFSSDPELTLTEFITSVQSILIVRVKVAIRRSLLPMECLW